LFLKEGVVCGALRRREQDDHAHYDQKDLHVLIHRTGSISSDKSRSISIWLWMQPLYLILWCRADYCPRV